MESNTRYIFICILALSTFLFLNSIWFNIKINNIYEKINKIDDWENRIFKHLVNISINTAIIKDEICTMSVNVENNDADVGLPKPGQLCYVWDDDERYTNSHIAKFLKYSNNKFYFESSLYDYTGDMCWQHFEIISNYKLIENIQ